nr:MAG TPA: Carcinustatin peptide [Caudoviricetes sp.]
MPPVCRSQRSGKFSRIGHGGPYSLGEQVGIYGAL